MRGVRWIAHTHYSETFYFALFKMASQSEWPFFSIVCDRPVVCSTFVQHGFHNIFFIDRSHFQKVSRGSRTNVDIHTRDPTTTTFCYISLPISTCWSAREEKRYLLIQSCNCSREIKVMYERKRRRSGSSERSAFCLPLSRAGLTPSCDRC